MNIFTWLRGLFSPSSFKGTVHNDVEEGEATSAYGTNLPNIITEALAKEPTLPPGQITEHFSWAEAMCNSGEPVPERYKKNAIEVAVLLERIRELFGGRPIKPNSWYRSKARNEELKKAAIAAGRPGNVATRSQHLTASAADINVRGVHPKVLQDVLESIWRGNDVTSMDVFNGEWAGPDKLRGRAICEDIRIRMRGLGRLAHRGAVHVDVRKGKRAIFNYK